MKKSLMLVGILSLLAVSGTAVAAHAQPVVSVMLIDGDYVAFEGSVAAGENGVAEFASSVPAPASTIQVKPQVLADNSIDFTVTVRWVDPARPEVDGKETLDFALHKKFHAAAGEKTFFSFGDNLRYALQVSAQ